MDREELIFALKVLPKDKTEKEFYNPPHPGSYIKRYKLLERLGFVTINNSTGIDFLMISITDSGLSYLRNHREDSSITALFYKVSH